MTTFYPIGTPGRPWEAAELAAWRARQSRLRSYALDVTPRLERLAPDFERLDYGHLDYAGETFALVALRSRDWDPKKPAALITGGVHGYETSGVMGAIAFMEERALAYASAVNLFVAPCVSPWAYERINRWTYDALDPNRNFRANSPCGEAASLIRLVEPYLGQFLVHIDLHETTDSDESEFRRALAARDGTPFQPGLIPDGFYAVADAENLQLPFQEAIIAAVERVTHIAPADDAGEIIGCPVLSRGVIAYPLSAYGMCPSITGARYTTTTEVYPDSPRASPQQCNAAQVAAVQAALDFALGAAR